MKEVQKSIWKFELAVAPVQELTVPKNARILSVGVVNNKGYLWAEVLEKSIEYEKITLLTIPTGTPYEGNPIFLGTLFYNSGKIIQHIFKKS